MRCGGLFIGCWSAVILLEASASARRALVEVTDARGGCGDSIDASYTLRESGSGYGGGRHRIEIDEVERLRSLLLAAQDDRERLPESLGITRDEVLLRRTEIVVAALESDAITPFDVPRELEPLLSYGAVRKLVLRAVDAEGVHAFDTNWCSFSVTLPGDPVVTAASTNCRPWMLPWTIRTGDREWQTWSPVVPEALRPLAATGSPNAGFLDGFSYWADEFWSDANVWGGVGRELNAYHARQLARNLGGWSDADRFFELVEVDTRPGRPPGLYVRARAELPSSIDEVFWSNPLEHGLPTVTWSELLELWADAQAAASESVWLRDWRWRGGEAALSAAGRIGHRTLDFEGSVMPAWVDAGLPGRPEFELDLGGQARAYLARGSPGSVITHAVSRSGHHWLDRQEVHFTAADPQYLLVTADGRFEHRRMAKR